MISYEEARSTVLSRAVTSQPVQKMLFDSLNLVLAEDVVSFDDIPYTDNSAMDGFAVRSEDLKNASRDNPAVLTLIGEVPAGKVFEGKVEQGQAVSIFTGAPIPEGADTVVEVEVTKVLNGKVYVFESREKGANIRRKGEDVKKGQIVFKKGTVLTPPVIGVLSSVGKSVVKVFKPVSISIVSTGSELVELDEELSPGKVRNSNTYLLEALLREYPILVTNMGTVPDELERIIETFEAAFETSDVVLTTGGVSLGEYDLVKIALERLGFRRVFWKVAQKPGKPLAFYEKEGKFAFGLPGNPAAVHVCFLEYVRPFILKSLGYESFEPITLRAKLKDGHRKKPGRLNFLRVRLSSEGGEIWAEKAGQQGSGVLSTSAYANAIALIPAEKENVEHGEEVEVHYFSNMGW